MSGKDDSTWWAKGFKMVTDKITKGAQKFAFIMNGISIDVYAQAV